ncbi:restriction endonuclease [Burkholderia ubonensis]|uniref:restriction endonuclease n=1 Tax=Burkholderia ubonensis TaxID=101571 RepID=UPI0009B3881D|nr:restriction endonuclease [Burkholderia ubonensis]
MKIEVAVPVGASTKERGDLLEQLCSRLLKAQSYAVETEIRFTATELDLLCKHKVSGKRIYVECKAWRDNIDANVLKNLAGTMLFQDYDEAWLISTAEFGKEAKGFVEEWQRKPIELSGRMSFYNPSLVIEALVNAGTIKSAPSEKAAEAAGSSNAIGDCTLSITPFGDFWLVTILSGGIPARVIAYHAGDCQPVTDQQLIKNLQSIDSSLRDLEFVPAVQLNHHTEKQDREQLVDVVQVQYADSWSDYRPSRPQDFVGRLKDQDRVFELFKDIIDKNTQTRVFAFTGDSGMGKSSIISKIVHRSKNIRNRAKYFVFAVDVRAATTPSYVYSALLRCLKSAQDDGFGDQSIAIAITDASNPLNSPSIRDYLASVEHKEQLIALVLDQFEELYSKPELSDVFERARSLLLSAAALGGNLCLGFAWKSDSTTHNEHPAYYFWHSLADYRFTQKLAPFTDPDSAAVLNIFEREIGQKLHTDLRHNLLVSSQGYPWLLKKLCIHLYAKITAGIEQAALLENKLDVSTLFDGDLAELNHSERACLNFVAQRAPVDWFEVLEMSGAEALNSLIHRRLVIKSGDRLNIYWDIFREYILTKKVPVIPLRYLPMTDFSSIYKVIKTLSSEHPKSVAEIARLTSFSEGTVQNIGTDINIFGLAARESGEYLLAADQAPADMINILRAIRQKFAKHAFSLALKDRPSNTLILVEDAVNSLKEIFPNNNYAEKTWRSYTVRLCRWLEICGFLSRADGGWIYRDKGDVVVDRAGQPGRAKRGIFTAATSPAIALDTLKWLLEQKSIAKKALLPKGYRNGVTVLSRLNLVTIGPADFMPNAVRLEKYSSLLEALWTESGTEPTLVEAVRALELNPNISGKDLASYFEKKFGLRWTTATQHRHGHALRQWANWLLDGKQRSTIPPCPGRG